MGWCDNSGKHEGWMQAVFADGRFGSGTSGQGIYVEGYRYLPADERDASTWGQIDPADLRPCSDIVAWRMACECGWRGTERRIADLPVSDVDPDYREPSEACEGRIFLPEWRQHVAPDNAVSTLEDMADELRRLEADIRSHVEASRLVGTTWEQIGRALGMTKQGAQQRFGA